MLLWFIKIYNNERNLKKLYKSRSNVSTLIFLTLFNQFLIPHPTNVSTVRMRSRYKKAD